MVYTRIVKPRDGDTETLADEEKTCWRFAASNELDAIEVSNEGAGVSAFKKN